MAANVANLPHQVAFGAVIDLNAARTSFCLIREELAHVIQQLQIGLARFRPKHEKSNSSRLRMHNQTYGRDLRGNTRQPHWISDPGQFYNIHFFKKLMMAFCQQYQRVTTMLFGFILLFSDVASAGPICNLGSVPAYYAFPIPAGVGQCTVANIPSAFGTIEGDFVLQATVELNNLMEAEYIVENGINNVIGGRLSLGLYRGSMIAGVAGTSDLGGALQTFEVPLRVITRITIKRSEGICSLLVDGTTAVSVNCSNTALIPPPSEDNNWSIFGVGAQKVTASSCGINHLNSGAITAITLIGGTSNIRTYMSVLFANFI